MVYDTHLRSLHSSSNIGLNSRLDSIQAAILLAKFGKLEKWTEARRRIASRYDELLRPTPVEAPYVANFAYHVYHQYTIRVTPEYPLSRDVLKEFLNRRGYGCGVYYPKPLHLHPHFKGQGLFEVSERLAAQVLSLPMHPKVTEENLNELITLIQNPK